ncbi:glycosyl hydrolase family 28-related protein [Caballeronia sp. J97]|uniref:glycosyl hydrolase family 28-related protein n=1 Tax=Caballeronia sp. J97 TaxID=2805429 RepID=UPI002AB17C2E|nr:glycosyl hydrolase family 28-related protein [Caballeronia sp. J97]
MVYFWRKWQAAGDALKTRRHALAKIIVACCGISGAAGSARRAQAAKSEAAPMQGASASMQLAESLSPDDRMVVVRGSLLQARIGDVSGYILAEGPIQGYATLRQYAGTLTRLLVSQHPAGHRASDVACYRLDPDDASSPDNGGTVIVSKSGKRWKRVFEGDIYARWFGAQGDGITDDADAINRAVAFAGSCHASTGRSQRVVLDNGTFRIAAASGTLAIPCHDDGRTRSAKDKRLAPEPASRQAYCVGVWPGVRVCGVNAVVKGAYRYGMADARQPIAFGMLDGHDIAFETGLENLTFIDCFIAFGALSATLACCIFEKLRFLGCGVGIYAAVLEQCMFSNIEAQGTGVPILVGGQWADRNDDYNERGGYADKCTFINVRNIYSRVYGDDERRIDTWFDATFFKTRNNESRLSAQLNAASQARAYPYRGICGFSIRVMSRYARPSNANVFMQISHAMSPRPAVLVDACQSAVFNGVYLERVGYRDNPGRTGPVGAGWNDPYLGDGVLVPAFVGTLDGASTVSGVNVQQAYGAAAVQSDGLIAPVQSWDCTLKQAQDQFASGAAKFAGDVTIQSGALRAVDEVRHEIGGLGLVSMDFNGASFDTGLSVPHDDKTHAVIMLVSRNADRSHQASSGLYLLHLPRTGTSEPVRTLVSGSDLLRFSVTQKGTLGLVATNAGAHRVLMLGNRPFA